MKVAVTGATGFVGRRVVAALRARGMEVRALVRTPAAAARVGPEVEVMAVGDMELANWAPAVEGTSAVIHLAARVHRMDDQRGGRDRAGTYHDANVVPTARLADAALAAGVRRMVFASSVKVHGDGRATPYRDSDDPAPTDAYGRSKLEAERELAVRSEQGLEAVCVRPPLVYGPGAGGNFRRLLRLAALSTRVPLPLGAIDNRRSLIFVDNLADAIALAATAADPVRGSFLVADQPPISTSDLVTDLAAALGRRAHLVPLPALAMRLARGLGFAAELARLTGDLTVDDARFREVYRWTPPVAPVEAIARTAAAWGSR